MLCDELDIIKMMRVGGWVTCLECKNWILAESFLFLNQKALSVQGKPKVR